jgi:hypothetical protein
MDQADPSELVERTTELDCIEQMLARAAAGAGTMVFIEGEAGIGKTGLVQAASRSAATPSTRRVRRASPLGQLPDVAILGVEADDSVHAMRLADVGDIVEGAGDQRDQQLRASDRPMTTLGVELAARGKIRESPVERVVAREPGQCR